MTNFEPMDSMLLEELEVFPQVLLVEGSDYRYEANGSGGDTGL